MKQADPGPSLARPVDFQDTIGPPRVERISQHVWAAIGYDLASVVLIRTRDGNVVVDTASNRKSSETIREAFGEKASLWPVKAIVYTHSHVDHIGGAQVWAEPGTEIWATKALFPHLLKQYGKYTRIEALRGGRQFGRHIPEEKMPWSAIGKRPQWNWLVGENGFIPPTHTFSGNKKLRIGGLNIELIEAHGETHDHLFVWVPEDKTLIAGDNFYWAFPNIYSLRGTSPRPVDDWIKSIDAMRRLAPEHLVPCHTKAIHGKEKINRVLTDYRDAIQWIRDSVVLGANKGMNVDTLAQNIRLPDHLAGKPYLREIYGQVDWAVRAIYHNHLGWFDGRPEKLYPLPVQQTARREIELMGGEERVLTQARQALLRKDFSWAVHLFTKIHDSGSDSKSTLREAADGLAAGYEGLARNTDNTNGRAYMLESAYELRQGTPKRITPNPPDSLMDTIPLEYLFAVSPYRLKRDKAMGMHESIQYYFPDVDKRFIMTVRYGLVEVVAGDPLPGTPPPEVIITMESDVFRGLSYKKDNPYSLFLSGQIHIQGGWGAARKFLGLFERGL